MSSNPPRPSPYIHQAIKAAAERHGLPVELVVAICITESGLNPAAMRYEPDFQYLWNCRTAKPYRVRIEDAKLDRAPADFPAVPGATAHSEWIAQQISFGLMQTMGALARQYGFEGYLTRLCDPELGCEIGCRYLAELKLKHFDKHGWDGVLAAYNAGSVRFGTDGKFVNQVYVDKVFNNGGAPFARAANAKP